MRKIEKFVQLLGNQDSWFVVEQILFQENQARFFQVLQLLEQQRRLTERHN